MTNTLSVEMLEALQSQEGANWQFDIAFIGAKKYGDNKSPKPEEEDSLEMREKFNLIEWLDEKLKEYDGQSMEIFFVNQHANNRWSPLTPTAKSAWFEEKPRVLLQLTSPPSKFSKAPFFHERKIKAKSLRLRLCQEKALTKLERLLGPAPPNKKFMCPFCQCIRAMP